MPITSRHIVGIEKIRIAGVGRSILGSGHGQNKGLEKPARMRQMPLGRAHIRHCLNDIIFRHQRLAEPLGKPSHLMITRDERLLVGSLAKTKGDACAMRTVSDGHVLLSSRLVFTSTTWQLHTRSGSVVESRAGQAPPAGTFVSRSSASPACHILNSSILARGTPTRQSCR